MSDQPDRRADASTQSDDLRPIQAATVFGPDRFGMTGTERLLLYRTAIQTGLRSNELRSLTRGRLYFDSNPPYITCKAGSTKNRNDARPYIQPELAASLKAHIARKAPRTPVFKLPHESNVARMLRDDLAEARKQWLAMAKKEPQEYTQRQQSDFLPDSNHEGEIFDFHCLRHTCGAWLAMTGAHPKVVQQGMRHQSITLTMDTYGHLFPGQEADAVGRLRQMLISPTKDDREVLRATGTDDPIAHIPGESPKVAQRQAQQMGSDSGRSAARTRRRRKGRGRAKENAQVFAGCELGR